MAPRWQYIPLNALDDEQLQQQSREWADQQAKQIAQDWRQAQTPPPLAPSPLGRLNEDLYPSAPTDAGAGAGGGASPFAPSATQPPALPEPYAPAPADLTRPGAMTGVAAQAGPAQQSSGLPNVPDWLIQIIQRWAPDHLKDNFDFIATVAAGAKAESGWDPRSIQPGGGGRGLFQFDVKGGMGTGIPNEQLFDPDFQGARIIPKYAIFYAQAPEGLSPAEKASWVAAMAERPLGYDDPNSQARHNYASAFDEITSGAQGLLAAGGSTLSGVAQRVTQPLRDGVAAGFSLPETNILNAIVNRALGVTPPPTTPQPQGPSMTEQAWKFLTEEQPWMKNLLVTGTKQVQKEAGISPFEPGAQDLTQRERYAQTRSMLTGLSQTLTPEDLIARGMSAGAGSLQRSAQVGEDLLKSRQRGEGLNPFNEIIQAASGGNAANLERPALPSGRSPGQAHPAPGLDEIFNMWERNRAVRNPPLLDKLKGGVADFAENFERQITDRFVDLNKLGRQVETAVSTYMGRLPGAQQRVIDDFTPMMQALNPTRMASNGHTMMDNFNVFVKLQRDAEVALAKSPTVTEPLNEFTQTGPATFSQRVAEGPSGLRPASAGVTGAADAQSKIAELRGQLQPNEWAQIQQADQIRQQALDRMLDDRTKSGLVPNEVRQWLLANYPHYNPTIAMRNVDEAIMSTGGGKSINQLTNNLRRLMDSGITSDTEEPSLSAIRSVMRSDLDVRRNDAVRTIVDALRRDGTLGTPERATYPGDRPGKLSWYQDGERWVADVPKEVERAAKNMDESSLHWLGRLGGLLNAPLRLGAVTLSPSFVVMNAAADFLGTFIREGGSAALRVPAKHIRAAGYAVAPSKFPLSASERQFIRAGGGMSALSRTTEHADIEKLIQESGGLLIDNQAKWLRFLKDALTAGPLRRYGERIEMGPRVATFEAQRARGASLAEAAMAGRRVTVDFARAGNSIRLANTWMLFLNARVQGTLQIGRTLRDNPNSRWRLASVAAIAAATYAHNRTEFGPELDDIPDWEKRQNAVIILGHGEPDPQGGFKSVPRISIPLREWGAVVQPLNYIFDQIYKKDPRTWQVAAAEAVAGLPKLAGGMLQTASPTTGETAESSVLGAIPAIARTPVELALNTKAFTGAPIEPQSMENLPPSEKVTDRTTGVAKLLSQAARDVGAKGLSPAQTDFIIQENLAGLGRMASGERLNPLESVYRNYAGQGDTNKYKQLDQEIMNMRERVAEQTRRSPEYTTATRDRQLQMLRQDQIKLEDQLKTQYGIDPKLKDYGLPNKYRGVSDLKEQKKIDDAISAVDDYEANFRKPGSQRQKVPVPTVEQRRLANRYSSARTEAYTKELANRRAEAGEREQIIQEILAGR